LDGLQWDNPLHQVSCKREGCAYKAARWSLKFLFLLRKASRTAIVCITRHSQQRGVLKFCLLLVLLTRHFQKPITPKQFRTQCATDKTRCSSITCFSCDFTICYTEVTSITEGNGECFILLDYLAFRSKVVQYRRTTLLCLTAMFISLNIQQIDRRAYVQVTRYLFSSLFTTRVMALSAVSRPTGLKVKVT
jgi:hypothetical protein